MTMLMINIALRILVILLIGFVSAVIGLILGAIIGGNLAAIYEILFGHEFVFNGRVEYEATGQIGFILGAFRGLVGSGYWLFGSQIKQ